uniref:C-type lectin domain-containing protein n=1 Tax=Megaselia scalaris TaxID=36166 RepID=T1GGF4_MEGSC
MKFIILLAVIMLCVSNGYTASPSTKASNDCPNCVDDSQYPNKWTMPLLRLGDKKFYLGIFFKANWFKATQYCRYHGMHLASINSQEENDKLEKHIRDFGKKIFIKFSKN